MSDFLGAAISDDATFAVESAINSKSPEAAMAGLLEKFAANSEQGRARLFIVLARRFVEAEFARRSDPASEVAPPHTDAVVSQADLADATRAAYRAGAAEFGRASPTDTAAAPGAAKVQPATEMGPLAIASGGKLPFFWIPPKWATAMRTDAASRAAPALKAAADLKAAQAAVAHAEACRQTGWMGA